MTLPTHPPAQLERAPGAPVADRGAPTGAPARIALSRRERRRGSQCADGTARYSRSFAPKRSVATARPASFASDASAAVSVRSAARKRSAKVSDFSCSPSPP